MRPIKRVKKKEKVPGVVEVQLARSGALRERGLQTTFVPGVLLSGRIVLLNGRIVVNIDLYYTSRLFESRSFRKKKKVKSSALPGIVGVRLARASAPRERLPGFLLNGRIV